MSSNSNIMQFTSKMFKMSIKKDKIYGEHQQSLGCSVYKVMEYLRPYLTFIQHP